ncbi:MAG: peptidase [Desulfurococcaceae archaeon]
MSVFLAKDLLKLLTKYHRVQGSSGLLKAIKEIKEELDLLGMSTKIFEIPSNAIKGFVETPVSWDIEEGSMEIKVSNRTFAKLNMSEHPTLIAAHSPPGEGHGKLVICDNNDISTCEGEVVLTRLPAYIAYKNIDANMILLYSDKRFPTAVPYTGLFIHRNEITNKVVINIPYTMALKLKLAVREGKNISVEWVVKSRYIDRSLHGLLTCDGDEPGILYISHICHPKPGAHDNASGSVANILTLLGIARSGHRFSHCHAWVPEYAGTVFIGQHLPWTPIGVVNLDMVGSKQWITGSIFNIVNAPLYMDSHMTMYTYLASKIVLDDVYSFDGFKLPGHRYSLIPYTAGSDHDVTLAWGWDSVMLNEWPSKYYHTDMDEITSISPKSLIKSALIAILAGFMRVHRIKEDIARDIFNKYVIDWYRIEALKNNLEIDKLFKLVHASKINTEKIIKLESPIMSKSLYKVIGHHVYLKLKNIRGSFTFLSLYAPLAYLNGIGEKDIFEMFQLENLIRWRDEEKTLIEYAWSVIKDKYMK